VDQSSTFLGDLLVGYSRIMPLQQNQVHFVVGKSLNFVEIYVSKLQLIGILIFLNGSAHI
jgi:hypothetical protein